MRPTPVALLRAALARVSRHVGVYNVALESGGAQVRVCYDLCLVRLNQIEALLGAAGLELDPAPYEEALRAAVHRAECAIQEHCQSLARQPEEQVGSAEPLDHAY